MKHFGAIWIIGFRRINETLDFQQAELNSVAEYDFLVNAESLNAIGIYSVQDLQSQIDCGYIKPTLGETTSYLGTAMLSTITKLGKITESEIRTEIAKKTPEIEEPTPVDVPILGEEPTDEEIEEHNEAVQANDDAFDEYDKQVMARIVHIETTAETISDGYKEVAAANAAKSVPLGIMESIESLSDAQIANLRNKLRGIL